MRKVRCLTLSLLLLAFMPSAVSAQDIKAVRGNCTPSLTAESSLTRGLTRGLPAPNRHWDASRIYKQMVLLIEFSDVQFSRENARESYNRMFNEKGYNERNGVGCVADYFRDQSAGLLNLEFDIYGPVKVDSKAQPYDNPKEYIRNYGGSIFMGAVEKVLADNPEVDFSQYDWNEDDYVDQVIIIYAGYSGNLGVEECWGYIWPNTASFSTVTSSGGTKFSNYSSSSELWLAGSSPSCGIGTVCHEFTHCLGLPDIYPTTSGAGYSVLDEWDLMDGGNFTNYGWCPPNFTPLEKMLLGWLDPIDLTEPVSIIGLKPAAEGGEVYRIQHTANEYLLLENRQQRGWDAGLPGKGLVIYHVNYDYSSWSGNVVNNNKSRRRFDLFHADNMDYDAWDTLVSKGLSSYQNKGMMNKRHLSTSSYPWSTDSTSFVNEALTDSSVPPANMLNKNSVKSKLLSKPITNIRMSDDGLISFDFMGGDPSGISQPVRSHSSFPSRYYDLQGRETTPTRPGIYIIRYRDGLTRKVFINP